jgi:thymidylate kinase
MSSRSSTAGIPPRLEAFMAALARSGVAWSLVRPRSSLAAPTGDVDVLVEPAELDRIARLLADCGFARMPVEGTDVHAAAYDRAADRFVWVHVQGALRLAGEEIPASAVLAAAGDTEGAREPAGDWLLWILLLRALVDKGLLAERYRGAVQDLAGAWTGGPERLVALARTRGVPVEEAVRRAAAGDWDGLLALSPPPAKRRSLPRRLIRAPRRLRALAAGWSRRGISVAVLGPDGAGKSSTVEALASGLPLPVRVQYMGLTGGQLPRADALRIPGVVFAARVGIIWLRYLRGLRQVLSGGIVVFDRYTLDAVAPSGMRLSPVARFSRQVQGRVVPMPNLVIVLDASGATLHRRSGEYDAETLEAWRQAFATLGSRSDRVRTIDAERPAAEVRREAKEAVWDRYVELRATRAEGR